MVPSGLYAVLAVTVKLILIQMITGETLGKVLISGSTGSREIVAGQQLFTHSSSRERRNVACRPGYYPHPNGTHCCIRCHKGTYVAQHCESEDKTTDCRACPAGAYMAHDNSAESCLGCQSCRPTFHQIPLRECSSVQDTVCGCAKNHYQSNETPEFFCNPCSACHNGTVLRTCTALSDAVCSCRPGFFLRARENRCFPCGSCREKECEGCDVTSSDTSPPNSSDLNPILATLVVILSAGALLLAGRWIFKQPLRKKLFSTFSGSVCAPPRTPLSAELKPTQPDVQGTTLSIPPESYQKEMLLPSPVAVPAPSNTPALPDCVPSAGETPIPDCPAVLYAMVDLIPYTHWKEFVRRLGLTDNVIARINDEERQPREAQYKMLRNWRLQLGHRATVERVSGVLGEMDLQGCGEAIRDVLPGRA